MRVLEVLLGGILGWSTAQASAAASDCNHLKFGPVETYDQEDAARTNPQTKKREFYKPLLKDFNGGVPATVTLKLPVDNGCPARKATLQIKLVPLPGPHQIAYAAPAKKKGLSWATQPIKTVERLIDLKSGPQTIEVKDVEVYSLFEENFDKTGGKSWYWAMRFEVSAIGEGNKILATTSFERESNMID